MLTRIILIIAIAFALYLLVRWFIDTPPQKVTKQLKQSGLIIGAGFVVILALTGKLHWLFALFAGLIPFAQRLLTLFKGYQIFKGVAGQFKKSTTGGHTTQGSGQQSTISTSWLKMTLDHDSGDLFGIVMQGRYRGKQLEEMPLEELISLLGDCRTQDEESATLLETYLDRRFDARWREQFQHEDASGQKYNHSSPADITVDEAYEILGLSQGANAGDIKIAHKRLIQKFHPDRGGSSYLAAKINKAKDVLTAHLEGNESKPS